MAQFRSRLYPNALIISREFEDLGTVYLLRNGRFIYSDGAVSVFDRLILPKAETERVEEQVTKNGGGGDRRGRRPPR